ncbi:GatB family leaderless bacteriocin [Bacillus sp. FSL R9-9481]
MGAIIKGGLKLIGGGAAGGFTYGGLKKYFG